jgi:hypothetical protein
MSATVDRELTDVLSKLGPWEREQVLKYARCLQAHEDLPRPDLSRYCGVISKEDAQLMREAIEEAFERV